LFFYEGRQANPVQNLISLRRKRHPLSLTLLGWDHLANQKLCNEIYHCRCCQNKDVVSDCYRYEAVHNNKTEAQATPPPHTFGFIPGSIEEADVAFPLIKNGIYQGKATSSL
jgi:hypothetical protein